ncbi:MAG: hypothetical protein GY765_03165 [bacterium]|nr:hypothetical protein [bacterium]
MTDNSNTAPADETPVNGETPGDDEKKKKPNKKGWLGKLARILVALKNCLDDPYITKLTTRGYDAPRVNQLIALHDEVVQLDESQSIAYKAQFEKTEETLKELDTAQNAYMQLRKLAKVALKGQDSTIRGLKLNVKLKMTLHEFISQAKTFYLGAADADTLEALATTGITAEEIASERAGLDALEELNIQQERLKKEAQKATEIRDERYDELETAYTSFYNVAQVALADEKQFLELLAVN